MALAGGAMNRPSARDLAPGPRFFLFAVISLVLMYFDQKDGWGERIRYGLQAAAYPIQVTIGSPGMAWSAATGFLRSRGSLQAENEMLREQARELTLRTMRMEALEHENVRLRGLRESIPPLVTRSQLVQVVNADLGRMRQRLVVDQGDSAGLFRSQVVVDAHGLVGQLARVGPWSSEVMLITDPAAGVPVEIVRSGVRTVAVGMGNENELDLPLLESTADVRPGDVLVTSGLGDVFPAGIPVGTITESRRNPDELLAFVRARPAARMAASRQLLALWFNPANPAAPTDPKLVETLPEAPVAQPVVAQPAASATRSAAPARPADTPPAPAPRRNIDPPGPR
jgi:rod shape-determining protein MreC